MKEIFVERRNNILRIAIRNKGILEECIVEEENQGPLIGEIYKGRVKNIIPATNSIFVDIGLNKEAYLYYSNELKESGIKKGDEIIVEVIKEPLNDKGPKVTTKFSIPSKYIVLESFGEGIEFSKRFKDEVKLIMRTESANVSIEELKVERKLLLKEYEEIMRRMNFSTKLGKLYGDNLALNKVLRDKVGTEPIKIVLDDVDDFEFAKGYLKEQENIIVKIFNDTRGLFDTYGIEKELLKLRHNKVKERNFEKTILETNLEAAKEIGRQILLRNMSGIIVIDFIDLRDKSHKSLVLKELKEALKEDGGNVKIFPFTELNLVQIARKRRGKSVYEYMEEKCPLCNGMGRLIKLSYLEGLIHNDIKRLSSENGIKDFLIELDENY